MTIRELQELLEDEDLQMMMDATAPRLPVAPVESAAPDPSTTPKALQKG